jgi:hypothetical protein
VRPRKASLDVQKRVFAARADRFCLFASLELAWRAELRLEQEEPFDAIVVHAYADDRELARTAVDT